MKSPKTKSEMPYEVFMRNEGIPVFRASAGTADVKSLPRSFWPRIGGNATFVELEGTFQAERGIYVAEIPVGSALEAEQHLYEKELIILAGEGHTEVWQRKDASVSFDWKKNSAFVIPRNLPHRLVNHGREPAIFMAVTTAPRVINALDDLDFVFNCGHDFIDLRENGAAYFSTSGTKSLEDGLGKQVWETHRIDDVLEFGLDRLERKVAGGLLTGYRMGKTFPEGHVSEWAAGRYHKAHYHGPGAVLLGLTGAGYALVWPNELTSRPYERGHGDKVVKVPWGEHSIYSPPNGWYHQHFNTSDVAARHIAVYSGSGSIPLAAAARSSGEDAGKSMGVLTLVDYEDEDPQIRRDFEDALAQKGLQTEMPPLLGDAAVR